LGSVIGGIIPLLINRNSNTTAGVPKAVYISFIVLMCCAAILGLFLLPPTKLTRDDGSKIANVKSRGFIEEFKSNLYIFTDWRLLLMIPAFVPAECFLVYGGSVNGESLCVFSVKRLNALLTNPLAAFHNNLRTRSLLSFISVVIQIPFGILLQWILDNERWKRKSRALYGLAFVGIPLMAAWIWEIVSFPFCHKLDRPFLYKVE
jgi:ABC-type sugar transport system permease subunit